MWNLKQKIGTVQVYSCQLKCMSCCFRGNIAATLKCIAMTADSLCDGDLVERRIRSSSNWGLLPLQVVCVCVCLHVRAFICTCVRVCVCVLLTCMYVQSEQVYSYTTHRMCGVYRSSLYTCQHILVSSHRHSQHTHTHTHTPGVLFQCDTR